MTLDPQVAAFLAQLAEIGAPLYGAEPTEVSRRAMDDGAAGLFGPFEPVPFEDRTIDGPHGAIPVRIYRPARRDAGPALVFFHGGGWVIGSIETHDDDLPRPRAPRPAAWWCRSTTAWRPSTRSPRPSTTACAATDVGGRARATSSASIRRRIARRRRQRGRQPRRGRRR